MEYKRIFSFDVDWNYRNLMLLALLALLPNFLGMVNIETSYGFKLHLFQVMIFLAAAIFGPFGGMVSGGFGSLFTAMAMHNPYVLIGNMLLGFFAGWFMRKGLNVITSVLVAYLIQVPWLWATDIYLMGMPTRAVNMIVVGLLATNIVWAIVAQYAYKPLKRIVA